MSDEERGSLCRKLDIICFLMKEKLSLSKYPVICKPHVEAHQGVNLGPAYKTELYTLHSPTASQSRVSMMGAGTLISHQSSPPY